LRRAACRKSSMQVMVRMDAILSTIRLSLNA
jgi:hypothetical protein